MTNEQLSEHLRELALSTGNTDYADALERAANLLDRADEPVAMRGDFDGNGYRYIDNGSGSDWKQRHPDWEALYSAPPARKPLSDEQVFADDGIMAANARIGLPLSEIMEITRAVEQAHGIVDRQEDAA